MRVGYDPAYGARPLKRAIQKEIENPLGRLMLEGKVRDGQTVMVDYDRGRGQLTFDAALNRHPPQKTCSIMTIAEVTKALDHDGFCVLQAVFSAGKVEAILRPLEKSLARDAIGVLGREGTAYAAAECPRALASRAKRVAATAIAGIPRRSSSDRDSAWCASCFLTNHPAEVGPCPGTKI